MTRYCRSHFNICALTAIYIVDGNGCVLLSQSILEGKVVSLEQLVRELNSKLRSAKANNQLLSRQMKELKKQNGDQVLR